MLVGSTSRVVAGRKALQMVYWRTSKKNGEMIKTEKNMVYGQDTPTPSMESVNRPIWVTTNRRINVVE
ncbi:unnamed protein product [Nezara viridula]|uniref:Uncharacterized protein n=1 Tax=Nezara viridula TaxID=85310 RepID=A0A9P0MPT3_NEZVI|nr:unnamed protein product [Nezara viridula]